MLPLVQCSWIQVVESGQSFNNYIMRYSKKKFDHCTEQNVEKVRDIVSR
jgi:hypothetical protein